MMEVEERLHRGQTDIVDADLADYVGSTPHAELMLSLARRIVDRRVLHLIRMWLECPVEETDTRGRKKRTTEARDSRRGIPQGSPISPLLANVYMRRFVLAWKKLGLERSLGSRIVTYADDLVILCKRGKAEEALVRMHEIMGKLKPTVNEEKTQICKVPEGEFDFLGYTFGRMYSAVTGRARMGMRPSTQAAQSNSELKDGSCRPRTESHVCIEGASLGAPQRTSLLPPFWRGLAKRKTLEIKGKPIYEKGLAS